MEVEPLYSQFCPNRYVGRKHELAHLPRHVDHNQDVLVDFLSKAGDMKRKKKTNKKPFWLVFFIHHKCKILATTRTPLQTSFDSLLKFLGYDTLWSVIAANNSSSSSPSNGGCPTSISYSNTPYAHQSTDFPYG